MPAVLLQLDLGPGWHDLSMQSPKKVHHIIKVRSKMSESRTHLLLLCPEQPLALALDMASDTRQLERLHRPLTNHSTRATLSQALHIAHGLVCSKVDSTLCVPYAQQLCQKSTCTSQFTTLQRTWYSIASVQPVGVCCALSVLGEQNLDQAV
jgi:hypothetical protein